MSHRLLVLLAAVLALASSAVAAAQGDAVAPRAAEWAPRDVVPTQFPVVFARFANVDGIVTGSVTIDGVAAEANLSGAIVRHAPSVALAPGPHRAWVRATDAAGRSSEVAWSFVVLPANVHGGAAFALAPLAHARAPAPIVISDATLGVRAIEVVPASTLGNLTVGVSRLDTLPPSVRPLWLSPLLLLDARAAADSAPSFESVKLTLTVPRSAVQGYGAEPKDLVALGFRDGQWEVLDRDRSALDEDPFNVTVVARSTSLHPLALVADVQAPLPEGLLPKDGAILREPPSVRAVATDNVRVDRVALTLDGVLVRGSEARSGEAGVSALVVDAALDDVADGRHVLELRAFDVAENVAARSWTFILDRSPPTFPTAAPSSYAGSATVAIDVALSDGIAGVDAASVIVLLDGVDVTRESEVTPLSVRFAPPRSIAPGEHVLTVRAHDRAGNEATLEHRFSVLAPVPGPALALALALIVGLALTRARTRRVGALPLP